MARFRIPTGRKVGRPPKKHRKTFQKNPISGAHKEKEPNIEQIKPQMISIRRYREIFGSSDEELEVEDFYGFRSEDLGLVAYKRLSSPTRISMRTLADKDHYGVASFPSHSPRQSPEKSLSPSSSFSENFSMESRKNSASRSENVYAKQYRKRETYERKFSPLKPPIIQQLTEPSPKLKSTSQIKFNFAPRGVPQTTEITKTHDVSNTINKPVVPPSKRKPQTVAQMLLAKAKRGRPLKLRKQQQLISMKPSLPAQPEEAEITINDNSQVRSRSGRVVKAKKLDYEDLITSPRCDNKKATSEQDNKDCSLPLKRTLDDDAELPIPKIQRVNDSVCDETGENANASKQVSIQDSMFTKTKAIVAIEPLSFNKPKPSINKVSVKRKSQRTAKVKNYKTFDSFGNDLSTENDTSKSDQQKGESKKSNKKMTKKGVKSEENLLKDESLTSSGKKDHPKPSFKSKRLQQHKDSEKEEAEVPTNESEAIKDQREERKEVINEAAGSESTSESKGTDKEGVHGKDDKVSLKTRSERKKMSKSYKDESASSVSSSEDEESNKPLSLIKKEIKDSPEKVVAKVIKVMRKVKMKNGQIKKKLVKVIKKFKPVSSDGACPKVPGMRRTRCTECAGCLVKEDCAECVFCLDKPKFGGTGTMKQACVIRRCINPQLPRAIKQDKKVTPKPEKTEKPTKKPQKPTMKPSQKKPSKHPQEKPKAVPPKKKKELQLKTKNYKKQKPSVKENDISEQATPSVDKPIFPRQKQQRPTEPKNLVKLSWSDNASEETIWKEGFGVCFTSGVPDSVQQMCYLCGSAGQDKMYYCKVCAEPFHCFCLEEEPVDDSTWCCDSCSTCFVCGLQDKLLMCDICQRGYHVECLGPNYPTEPEGDDDTWICGRCVKCKSCGSRSAGEEPEATWMHDFTHCYSCGTNWEQGNYCPVCEKCYSDNDFDSKMIQCVQCDHWIHASCHDINADQYECLSDLPETIPFVCKLCCADENPKWFQEVNDEMVAGFNRVLDEVANCKSYEPLIKFFGQANVDNGHPKDIEAIKEKAKNNKYKFIMQFTEDVIAVFKRVHASEEVKADPILFKHYQTVFAVYEREVASMFPWHKLESLEDQTPEKITEEEPPITGPIRLNGVIGKPIILSGWDHSYSLPPCNEVDWSSTKDKDNKSSHPKDFSPSNKGNDCLSPPKDNDSVPASKSNDAVPPPKDDDSATPKDDDSATPKENQTLSPPKDNKSPAPCKENDCAQAPVSSKVKDADYLSSESNADLQSPSKEMDTLPPPKESVSPLPESDHKGKDKKSPEKMEVDDPNNLDSSTISSATKVGPDSKSDLTKTTKGGNIDTNETSSPKPSKFSGKSSWSRSLKYKKSSASLGLEGKTVEKTPQYTESNDELGLTKVLDTRKCQLCCCYGDDKPSMAGRLLYCGLDEWVHVNCGLWSAEVFEDDDKLQNIQTAITRGKQMRCEHCYDAGATVGCCEPRCPMNYHFICARNAKSVFQDDKKVYCSQHSFRSKEELIMEGDQFRVDRRVFVDLSKVRTVKKGLKGAEPNTIQLVQGAMKVESLGKLSKASDHRDGIFPIGFKVTRLYWSTIDPRRRCRYYCTIEEKPYVKVKSCAEDTQGMATTEDTVHHVIAHNVVDKNKPVDLICKESSKEILNSSYNEHDSKIISSPNKDPYITTKEHKGAAVLISKELSPNSSKERNNEISKILSGYKQILPSRPAPLLPTFRTATTHSVPRKILPNLKKAGLVPGTQNSLQLTGNGSSPQTSGSHSSLHLPGNHSLIQSSGCPSSLQLFGQQCSVQSLGNHNSLQLPGQRSVQLNQNSLLLSGSCNSMQSLGRCDALQSSGNAMQLPGHHNPSQTFVNNNFVQPFGNINSLQSPLNQKPGQSSCTSLHLPGDKQSPANSTSLQSSTSRNSLQSSGSSSLKHHSTPLTSTLSSLLSPVHFPHRRKAEPLSPGIPGLPRPKKQRKMSIINEEAETSLDDHPESTISGSKKDKVISPRKEKCTEISCKQDSKSMEKTSNVSSKHDNKDSNSNSTVNKLEGSKTIRSRQVNSTNVKFIITNDEGLKLESDSYKAAWKKIYDMVRDARMDRLLKDIPFIGLQNVSMVGLKQESVVYMLEQLPGAHLLKKYKFKYHKQRDSNSNGDFEGELKENPSGCCRTEIYKRSKKYDMFAFLGSEYRTPPKLADNADDQEWSEPNYEDIKRATALDLPMAMRYRQLKENNYNRKTVAVYRSGIHGRGLYCVRNIAAGELVIEYSGELIRSTLTDKRENYYDSKGIGCYMFRIDSFNVVDATTSGNAARFINHSCECNCYSKIVGVDGKKKILIFASRSISPGEELTYDYKFPVEDVKLPCHCNSKKCRKYLN